MEKYKQIAKEFNSLGFYDKLVMLSEKNKVKVIEVDHNWIRINFADTEDEELIELLDWDPEAFVRSSELYDLMALGGLV